MSHLMLERKPTFSLEPRTLEEAMRYAEIMAKSSVVPKSYYGKPGDILVAVQMGMELGLKPIQSLQNIALINGKPSLYGDALLALVKTHPRFVSIEESIEQESVAVCVLTRKGNPPHVSRFSIDDAKRANLWGKPGPWTQYPFRMLQMRARGFALRDVFPDAINGLITTEEAMDMPLDSRKVDSLDAPEGNIGDFSNELKNDNSQAHPVLNYTGNADVVQDENGSMEDQQEETETLVERLRDLILSKHIPQDTLNKWYAKANVNSIYEFDVPTLKKCIDFLED